MATKKKTHRLNIQKFFSPVDSTWYLHEYPDVKDAGISPRRHFMNEGIREGRHPRFDRKFYLQEYEDVAAAGIDPLQHYLNHGRHEGRHPAFDENWYLNEYEDVKASGIDARLHYERYGRSEGRHPAFDRRFYNALYPEAAETGLDPYSHYRTIGKADFRHAAFMRNFYLAENPDVKEAGLDPYQHFLSIGALEGRCPSFNRNWYLHEYPDIPAYGLPPLEHYIRYGKFEGRSPEFNHHWYGREYGDVAVSGVASLDHYYRWGKAQGRKPSQTQLGRKQYKSRLKKKGASYLSHFEYEQTFNGKTADVKAIAFYLPQFHECDHNNRFWGRGFTEWTNTRKASPKFPGHYQPRIPHSDIGYYDLSDPKVLGEQARMARRHGIHGFCFYHYWFSGERVLETPVDNLLNNPDIDINYMLCWANENWTRTWDGKESDVLLEQKYNSSDALQFITDLERYLIDPRYIKLNGSPVVLVYKPHLLKDFEATIEVWKTYWRGKYDVDLVVWVNRTDPSDHSGRTLPSNVDGIVEFPPNHLPETRHAYPYRLEKKYALDGWVSDGNLFDYEHMVDDIVRGRDLSPPPIRLPFYRSVMLGWDNSARRSEGWSVWHGFSLDVYYEWLTNVIADTRSRLNKNERFVFINAWNEWAEGTYLEPDEKFGYANLNTTSRALFGMPFVSPPEILEEPQSKDACSPSLAVHLHIYYKDLAKELVSQLVHVPQSFDVFVTADCEEKLHEARLYLKDIPNVRGSEFVIHPNVGRDIAPLVYLGKSLLKYDIICHYHTKRSLSVNWGDSWRRYLTWHLLGSSNNVRSIINRFVNDKQSGVIYPANYPLIARHLNWGGSSEICSRLLNEFNLDEELPGVPEFASGSFFWARTDAIAPILSYDWNVEMFEPEDNQLNQTLAHGIERLWSVVSSKLGFSSLPVINKETLDLGGLKTCKSRKRLSLFVHYDASGQLSPEDAFYLAQLEKVSDKVVFITNSDKPMSNGLRQCVNADVVFVRWNRGFDFGAWRDTIWTLGREEIGQYDEIIFANNSCYGPLIDLETFLQESAEDVDFWGVTGFPYSPDSPRPEARKLERQEIPEHIQSYFFVVKGDLARSDVFWNFWGGVFDHDDLIDVVAHQEVAMTKIFASAGFKYEIKIPESLYLQEMHSHDIRYNAPYNSPLDMLLLGSPFIKKKAVSYSFDEALKASDVVAELGVYPFKMFNSVQVQSGAGR